CPVVLTRAYPYVATSHQIYAPKLCPILRHRQFGGVGSLSGFWRGNGRKNAAAANAAYGHLMRGGRIVLIRGGRVVLMRVCPGAVRRGAGGLGWGFRRALGFADLERCGLGRWRG